MECEAEEEKIPFTIIYGSREVSFELPQFDTVWNLKVEIFHKLDILPMNQIIDCWVKQPEEDNEVLANCCDPSSNVLVVYNSVTLDEHLQGKFEYAHNESKEEDSSTEGLEICAAMDFIEYFSNNFDDRGIGFHVCRLEDAISKACFTDLENRKILLLYLHNKESPFAKIFGENLCRSEVKTIINDKFFLLGWNLENEEYHPSLIKALQFRHELSEVKNFVESKTCAALLIVPVKNSFSLFSCMRAKVSQKDFYETLKKAVEFLNSENEIEKDLKSDENQSDDLGSTKYQQLMLELLGDRDYVSFDYSEFDLLKKKIAYAFYGPPTDEKGYTDKQMKQVNVLFAVIVKENNLIAKWKDRVILSFIYNCTEPLPSDKKSRAKKYEDYNPKADFAPVPIFILRKCKNSENPCRVIIDDNGRVYKTWHAYLTRNKLQQCEMILPLNGRYQADEHGAVILERHLSPACGIDQKVLYSVDIASTAAGLVSGGVVLAATIPAVTVAPVALVVAGATGIGVGLYSIGRSAYALYDRKRHKETMSFTNSEARGAYLSIVAGGLGFVGAGANMAVSQLAARGFNIGQSAGMAVNVINIANLSASGISVANSGFDVIDQWLDGQTPSALTLVQLSSSLLFFGHAVYNFKSASTIIKESQAQTIQDYQESLRSNRHRKTFNKLMKETVRQNGGDVTKGQAEVIKTITKISNKDEVFATLTRMNKKMNENKVRFSAEGGEIKLNGVTVDVGKFGAMETHEAAMFLRTLPDTPEPSQSEVRAMNSMVQISFRDVGIQEGLSLAVQLAKIFINTEETIKEKIINAVVTLVRQLVIVDVAVFEELSKLFSGSEKYVRLFTMVNSYFQEMVSKCEEKYQKWLETKDPEYEEPVFMKLSLDYSKRASQLFEYISMAYFVGTKPTKAAIDELMNYFYTWFAKTAVNFVEKQDRKRERRERSGTPKKRVKCSDCGGTYYN